MDNKPSSSKKDRKTVEKIRRNEMKNLYNELGDLVPRRDGSCSRDGMALPDQIDQATNYITQLQGNVENLRQQRDNLRGRGSGGGGSGGSRRSRTELSNSPVQVQVNETGGGVLEIILVTGLECQFVFTEAMRILDEENADVIDANYSVVESTVFHTIHAQIGDAASSARISERLQRFAL